MTSLNMHINIHVAGIVITRPAKNVNNPITPLTRIAVKIIMMLVPVILKKFFITIGKLFIKVENAFDSFATTEPVKWENNVNLLAWISKDKSDNTARPAMANNTESATKIYAMISRIFTAKNGRENKRDAKPNLIDFQKTDK